MTAPQPGCPEWCEEKDEHTTHRRFLTNRMYMGAVRHENIQLGLIRPPRRRHTRVEMIIRRGKKEVMRFEIGWLGVVQLAEELHEAGQLLREFQPCGCQICRSRSFPPRPK